MAIYLQCQSALPLNTKSIRCCDCEIIVAVFTGYVVAVLKFILKRLVKVQRRYLSLPNESAASFGHKLAFLMHRYVTYI